MSLVKVLFDFLAQDVGELSVSVGEVVRLSSSGNSQENSGWTLVEKTKPPYSRGYVPTGYLGSPVSETVKTNLSLEVSKPSARSSRSLSPARTPGSSLQKNGDSPTEAEPTRVSSFARIRRLSDPRLPEHLLETLTTADANSPAPERASASDLGDLKDPEGPATRERFQTRSDPGGDMVVFKRANRDKASGLDLEKVFARHDHWFDQVMDARARQYDAMETALKRLNQSMSVARENSEKLVSNIMQVDAQMDNEKQRWKDILDQDNARLNQHVSQLYT